MSVSPGAYLRGLREADGRTIGEVAELLRMLRLCGLSRPWPRAEGLEQTLVAIEADVARPSHQQLLSLSLIVTDFRPARYRELANLRLKEAALG